MMDGSSHPGPADATGCRLRAPAGPGRVRVMSEHADGAILGARIRTLDGERPRASALAWRDGRLIAVGDDAEVREHVGPRTTTIDGRDMVVLPGLTDSHIHPFWGTLNTRGVD